MVKVRKLKPAQAARKAKQLKPAAERLAKQQDAARRRAGSSAGALKAPGQGLGSLAGSKALLGPQIRPAVTKGPVSPTVAPAQLGKKLRRIVRERQAHDGDYLLTLKRAGERWRQLVASGAAAPGVVGWVIGTTAGVDAASGEHRPVAIEGWMSAADVARQHGMSPSSISFALRRLVEAGKAEERVIAVRGAKSRSLEHSREYRARPEAGERRRVGDVEGLPDWLVPKVVVAVGTPRIVYGSASMLKRWEQDEKDDEGDAPTRASEKKDKPKAMA